MEQILTGLVRNQPGVLALISEKFRDMKINIKSVVAAETEDEHISHITIVAEATDFDITKLQENFKSLIEIQKFEKLGQGDHHERELVLVKVSLESGEMAHIMQISELFRAHVVGVGKTSMTLEFAGDDEQVRGFINMIKPYGIKGLARTGRTAIKKDE